MLASVRSIGEYESAGDFFKNWGCNVEDLEVLFKVKDEPTYLAQFQGEKDTKNKADYDVYDFFYYLNEELDWCDEEAIMEVLKAEKEKYFVDYNSQGDFFAVFKVEDGELKE